MKSKILVAIFLSMVTAANLIFAQNNITIQPDLTSHDSLVQWKLDGANTWNKADVKLLLYKAGVPSGSFRRPSALAILKTKPFKYVSVEADLRSTAPVDVIRRDLSIIVGYESPARFYYIHLASITDNNHNGIFLVNNTDRQRIDSGKGTPQLKDTSWHHVKVIHDGITGLIQVFVDKSAEAVLEAIDKTICCGQIGFGSFDDTGEFRNINITGFEK